VPLAGAGLGTKHKTLSQIANSKELLSKTLLCHPPPLFVFISNPAAPFFKPFRGSESFLGFETRPSAGGKIPFFAGPHEEILGPCGPLAPQIRKTGAGWLNRKGPANRNRGNLRVAGVAGNTPCRGASRPKVWPPIVGGQGQPSFFPACLPARLFIPLGFSFDANPDRVA